jgi:hypothetical protein
MEKTVKTMVSAYPKKTNPMNPPKVLVFPVLLYAQKIGKVPLPAVFLLSDSIVLCSALKSAEKRQQEDDTCISPYSPILSA